MISKHFNGGYGFIRGGPEEVDVENEEGLKVNGL